MSKKNSKKIFVVDDDEMLSMALEDYLTRKTLHEVHLFSTGEECLKHLRDQPDIIILDYHLNSVTKDAENGVKILEHIKKLKRDVQVIMLSSQDAYSVAIQTITRGAEEYVIKDEQAFEKIAAICNAY
jgi:DNA-binding NarL/FixJ family response regulator